MDSTGRQPLVLIVDEVPALVRLIELELGFHGMRMDTALLDGDPLGKAQAIQPDVIVIGAVLPTPGIYDLLEQLRASVRSKLLFINGTGNDSDAALALQSGADDSLSRPFLPEQLVLHIRNVLGLNAPGETQLQRGELKIDVLRRLVWRGEMKLATGTNEWGLLLALAHERGPVAAEELLTRAWGPNYASETRFLQLWIHRLRVNLGDDPDNPRIVLGDIEQGYWLAE